MKKSAYLIAAGLCFTSVFVASEDANPVPNHVWDTEVSLLTTDPRWSTAFETVANQHDGRLRDMVTLNEIPAPPFAEEARAAAFAHMLRETGFGEVSIDEAGNVIARRTGTVGRRTIMMAAHIDTVFPAETDVTVSVDGNRFEAPGIGDNTRGMVMILEIASAIVAADLRTRANIVLVGDVGEEGLGDLRGVRHIFREGADHPDAFIAIDGGGDARIIASAIGSNRYRVTFGGAGGHSWSDFGAANPHHAAARAITHFSDAALPITQDGNRSSFSVGRIGGGTSVNSIAFESWFEVDMRSGDPAKLAELDAVFQSAMQQGLVDENEARTRGDAITIDVSPIGNRPAGRGDRFSPLVQRAEAVLRAAEIEANITASSTDSNIPISMGIPAITIGRCGTSGRAHSLDEFWIDDDDVIECTLRGLQMLVLEAGLAN